MRPEHRRVITGDTTFAEIVAWHQEDSPGCGGDFVTRYEGELMCERCFWTAEIEQ